MRQKTLSVALEVKPASFDHLSSLLDQLRDRPSKRPERGPGPFADFQQSAPALHFMSISVFPGYDYDPLLVIEANFDGEPGPFWAQLEAVAGTELRNFLRCCKRPLDGDGPLYDAITARDARAPIAPYLQARALTPTVYHHGNRGMARDRILAEFALFKATRAEIGANDASYRAQTPVAIHARLRAALVGDFPWLNQPAAPRIGFWENIGDRFNMFAFVVIAVFALSLPGLILAQAARLAPYLTTLAVAFVVFAAWLKRIAAPLPTTRTPTRFTLTGFLSHQLGPLIVFALMVAVYAVVADTLCLPAIIFFTGRDLAKAWLDGLAWIGLGLLSAPVTLTAVLVWLRSLERADSSQDTPPVDPRILREMAQREDWTPQNHMGSIVLIKPGLLRIVLLTVGHRGLGLLLRLIARNGYLGSMRTIHFAHWALVNNRSRLMFHSNFDQTWESYLDDFIEKAHVGLTLAWTCGVGFPPTRFLIYDGASHGTQFKQWARHSMAVSRFWYSAYKDLTTEQIERNYRIALGLRKTTLSSDDAQLWINDL